ncbi:MAG: hypothetical protein ACR2PX_09070 [Endozoicomonas sp.]|uniref:hypothetical protein n=1 Tax=Endozoicomonas sp. TaxID=1892382 RepID=UPI003D9B4BD4
MFLRSSLSTILSSFILALGSLTAFSVEAGEVFKWVENAYTHGSEYKAVINANKCQLEKRSDQPSSDNEDDWTYSFSLKGASATKLFSRSNQAIKASYILMLNDYMVPDDIRKPIKLYVRNVSITEDESGQDTITVEVRDGDSWQGTYKCSADALTVHHTFSCPKEE